MCYLFFLPSICAKLPHAAFLSSPKPTALFHPGAKFYCVNVSGNRACPWSVLVEGMVPGPWVGWVVAHQR